MSIQVAEQPALPPAAHLTPYFQARLRGGSVTDDPSALNDSQWARVMELAQAVDLARRTGTPLKMIRHNDRQLRDVIAVRGIPVLYFAPDRRAAVAFTLTLIPSLGTIVIGIFESIPMLTLIGGFLSLMTALGLIFELRK